ncbi:hypothetical protein QBC40DRAFT_183264 [Triangularia verruculosa]|uniref:Uncharacterized protein n=1 Tax=Triangularia verruculosa TaxID=2587418 RepID=A0AAN6XAN5_9PEZI|nr:hypothetical protein QBC40DRAFT_183264 [Triangularia verruculosa]
MTAMAAPTASASLEADMARVTLPPVITEFPPPVQEQNGGGPASSSDGPEDDEDFEDDQADAQSLMQPAISPLATLFTSPKTPAAERMAAMDRLSGGGIFERIEDDHHHPVMPSLDGTSSGGKPPPPPPPRHSSEPLVQMGGAGKPGVSSAPQAQPLLERLPTPWQAGPKQFHITEPGRWSSMSLAIKSQSSRHKRASSVSENAMLKRLSKALPSISIPSNFMPSIPTPPFFSSHSSHNTSPTKDERTPKAPQTSGIPENSSGTPRTSSLRRTTSDDSLLYHTLSRVSSLGDDTRFANVREQVNVRMKAILDSFEGPSFKMPQMPNLLNTPLVKKSATEPITATTTTPHRSGSFSVSSHSTAPQDPLDKVLETLTGDIVVMGGYRGSILRSAKPPHRRLWVPVKVQLNIRKVNLEVGLESQDEVDMEKSIFADGMLKNIGPVDISKRLFKRLRECENARAGKLRVHDYGYDWRLSPHLLSQKLVKFLESLPSNQPGTAREKEKGAWVISHSLGGLITRHAVNARPELFAGVVYVGVPQRCINILGPLRNGDAVLLNEKILTAHVNFSLRTTFVFLPEDGFCFVDKETGEHHNIDFYNVNDWVRYRLCPSVSEPALPAKLGRQNNGTFSSLLSLSESLDGLRVPLRSRSNTQTTKRDSGVVVTTGKDRTLAPQMGGSSSSSSGGVGGVGGGGETSPVDSPSSDAARAKNLAYLARTLREIKRFRAELAHNKVLQERNEYPPLALMYAKDIPTTYACRVAGREGIAHADAYDDLMFKSGDGVVLAKEAMLPEGYEVVKGGRVCTDRGHITMLGDLAGVGRALEAVVRGRRKGIGLGVTTEGK